MRLPVLFFLIGLLVVPVSQATAEWRIVETPQLTMLSSVSERATRRNVEHYHYFREGIFRLFPSLSEVDHRPLLVILVDTRRELRPFVHEDFDLGGVIGLYREGFDADIVVTMDFANHRADENIIYHEYAHRLLRSLGPTAPWVNEGLAQTFETLEIRADKIEFGEIHNAFGDMYLNFGYKMQSERLVNVDWGDPTYQESHDRPEFYISAFLTTHFFFQNRDAEVRRRFMQFAIRGEVFPESSEDFKERLGYTYEELDREIRKYASRGRYQIVTIRIDDLPKPPPIVIRDATLVETNAILARLKTSAKRYTEAETLIDEGMEEDPNYSPLIDSKAYLYWHQDREDEMMEAVEQAVAQGSRSPHTLLSWSTQLFEEAIADGAVSNREMNELARSLMMVIQTDPGQAEAYRLLAELWRYRPSEEPVPESYLRVTITGFARYAYRDPALALSLAELLWERGHEDLAQQVLTRYFQTPRFIEDARLLKLAVELNVDPALASKS